MAANEPVKKAVDSSDRVNDNNYDRGITPAETAARIEREGQFFKSKPTEEREAGTATDDQTDPDSSINTTEGYTVDKEGLINNYAVEPEMYYDTPGDATQEAQESEAQQTQQLTEANQDKQGQLTSDSDVRGKGPGAI